MASEPYGKVHAFGGERGVGDFERALRDREWAKWMKKTRRFLDQLEREEPKRKKLPPPKEKRVPINMGKAFRH
jgi:hypothetical protein